MLAYTGCFSRMETIKDIHLYLSQRLRIKEEDMRLWLFMSEVCSRVYGCLTGMWFLDGLQFCRRNTSQGRSNMLIKRMMTVEVLSMIFVLQNYLTLLDDEDHTLEGLKIQDEQQLVIEGMRDGLSPA